jgi:hypothetical protein
MLPRWPDAVFLIVAATIAPSTRSARALEATPADQDARCIPQRVLASHILGAPPLVDGADHVSVRSL